MADSNRIHTPLLPGVLGGGEGRRTLTTAREPVYQQGESILRAPNWGRSERVPQDLQDKGAQIHGQKKKPRVWELVQDPSEGGNLGLVVKLSSEIQNQLEQGNSRSKKKQKQP